MSAETTCHDLPAPVQLDPCQGGQGDRQSSNLSHFARPRPQPHKSAAAA